GIRDRNVTGVQTCALPISEGGRGGPARPRGLRSRLRDGAPPRRRGHRARAGSRDLGGGRRRLGGRDRLSRGGAHAVHLRGRGGCDRHVGGARHPRAARGGRVMRVLHVDPERAWGGGEVQVLALVSALAARGHASTVAAHPEGPLARAAGAAGARIIPLGIANHFDVRAALVLRRLAPGFDVVHFHTARAHALAPLSRGRGARLVVTRRMDYVPAGGPYVRFLYNRAVDAVIAISDGVRAALVRAGVRAERIR